MDNVMYGTLLAVCASSGLSEEAQNYFNQMKDEGLSPNLYHYSSLLNAYSYDGNYRKSDELMEELKSSGLAPNKVFFFFCVYLVRFQNCIWELASVTCV